ncbi:hypothetical protein PNH38_02755 [Anoxybacillus rupiensis]|uniref:Uncharacterized protein n=1 Tax=Anoxybacteroides rupiense TaxID=311460 RepID=A0ABT5W0F3_9BACL|nr:hypothetical protein [Anoxybacillus rupiensis]
MRIVPQENDECQYIKAVQKTVQRLATSISGIRQQQPLFFWIQKKSGCLRI